jgi:kynurenine formamidase
MPPSAEFRKLAERVSNWGRWGAGDEIGTLNLVTPEVTRAASQCVQTGRTYSLAMPLSEASPQTGLMEGRINPLRTMVAINVPMGPDPSACRYSDDVVVMGVQAATHWDALSHVSFEGKLYNGFGADEIDASGARRCGIERIHALCTRGVLLDVARAHGVERLAPGFAIGPAQLDAAVRFARVEPRPGDALLIRTGQAALYREGKRREYSLHSPGLCMESAAWFRERDIAAVATDTLPFELYPSGESAVALPVHVLHLVYMGMTQGQNFDLEELSAACAASGTHAFFLEASPQPFTRAVGTPVNPVAIF